MVVTKAADQRYRPWTWPYTFVATKRYSQAALLLFCFFGHQPALAQNEWRCSLEKSYRAAFRGKPLTPERLRHILESSRANVLRLIEPGKFYSMEYRGNRVNVEVSHSGLIIDIRCG
jgi:hypothetical protein